MITRHKLFHTNWAPTKNIYRGCTRILHPVCSRVCCYQHPNPNWQEEITKSNFREFYSYIGIHKNELIDKKFSWKRKICEVSQDTNELFVCTIKLFWIPSIAIFPLWYIPFHANPFLNIGISVSPLVLGLFLVSGC